MFKKRSFKICLYVLWFFKKFSYYRYVRVSTDNQRDNGYSIDSQPRMIKEYNEYFYILLFAFNFILSIDSFVLSILLLNPRPLFHL